ncbi:XdhC family protein [Dokdonella immobilis]|uniref:Xanthine dehydrogenase accessory factor n=1 Tax=Dokdonella immobilis TaxID=578942 RepID=A0A1I5AL94_9GAMM|nr:XdhC/CoxI family protein [Dokdonella immobilis]SFN63205.1 xanthine dehydrogenase accessory factor [Dokdonella immobilis]
MDERLFAALASWLEHRAVVLASVVAAQGATPRRRGSRMLVTAASSLGSIGGGLAEARVLDAARGLLESTSTQASIEIDLGGGAQSAGVCGGRMRIALRRWSTQDLERARAIRDLLAGGDRVVLGADDLGAPGVEDLARPDVRLLIVGAGHCGAALCELAARLEFDIHVFDARGECLEQPAFASAHTHAGDVGVLGSLLEGRRDVQAVLLNRDFHADVAALEVLCARPPRFLGMLGSRRRIGEVRKALPGCREVLRGLVAPVGLDIDAETPHEIAVSILAQLIAERRHY